MTPAQDIDRPSDEEPTKRRQQPESGTDDGSEIDQLRAKAAELEQSADSFRDQLLRKAAEFENYKKRIENDYSSMVRFSTEDLIQKLLPVMDDFERMIKANRNASAEDSHDGAFMKGVELIYSKFRNIMESQGVKEFESLGKPFDPELHDALMQMPKEGIAPHTVIEEVEKGYKLHDKVVRHARVIVSAEAGS